MPIYPPTPGNRAQAIMMPALRPTVGAATHQTTLPPNTPQGLSLAQGLGSDLTVTWSVPTVDNTHGAAAAYNLEYSTSGVGNWTTVSNVTSPYDLQGLSAGTAMDVRIQSTNAAGASAWSAASTLTTAAGQFAPNAPAISQVGPPLDGTNTSLLVAWTAPTADGTHGAAASYNLRYRTSPSSSWTTVSGVTSPYTIVGLGGAMSVDIAVQAVGSSGTPSIWSDVSTASTWGATVAPGDWTAATTQAHGANVAPNGGVNMFATPAPTAVTGAAFAWSSSASSLPTTNLIAAAPDGKTNGWGQYFTAPATSGTYFLWMLAQGSGGATIGALVSPPITVS
jgi:fibronectin type III domain protein